MRYRYILFVHNAVKTTAAGQAVLWDPDAGNETFNKAEASSTGNAPSTHAMCNTIVNSNWSTGPLSYLTPFVGVKPWHDGYRIPEGKATSDDLSEGIVEHYEEHPQQGWGWYEIGTGKIQDISQSTAGLIQIIPD